MTRGELWTVSGGVYAAKPLAALIIQDDLFDATESIVVIPLTTTAAHFGAQTAQQVGMSPQPLHRPRQAGRVIRASG